MLKDNVVWLSSLIVVLAISVFALFGGDLFSESANSLLSMIETNFSWLFLLAMFLFVIFCGYCAFTRLGNIKLGSDNDKPEHSMLAWLAMLFCAGMGVGLVFWGVAEPISHYVSPAPGIEPGTPEAAEFSMRACFMHWGIDPWAAYAVIGLGLAYFHYRKGRPLLISSLLFVSEKKENKKSVIKRIVDVFAVVVSVAGVATSLGLGCLQISAGLEQVFGVPNIAQTWVILVLVICIIYTLSSVVGINKGIKKLSSVNVLLCLLLGLACFIFGPTLLIMDTFTTGLGSYINYFIVDSLNAYPFSDATWLISWRVFYWAWWIAWSPFVGIFIAKISKGRTVREFVLGVVIIPALLSIIWFSVFGGLALDFSSGAPFSVLENIAATPEIALFAVVGNLPFGEILCMLAIVVIIIFFITSADSATYVLGTLSSKGSSKPSVSKRIIWGIVLAVIALALLLRGGIKALQTLSIAAALPFVLIMLIACACIIRSFRLEIRKKEPNALYEDCTTKPD